MALRILFLGTKIKLLPIVEACKDHDCRFIRMGIHSNNDEALDEQSYDINDDSIFDGWSPDMIVNLKEQEWYLNKELELAKRFGLETFLTEDNIRFFATKEEQDRIFKELRIPTVPNDGDEVICKSDLSGGTEFKVVPRSEATGFFQNHLEIDYILSCHFYADYTKWHWLNTHVMFYEDNCPVQSYTPFQMRHKDFEIIDRCISRLSYRMPIQNRLFGWQFLKSRDGDLYSIDFNLRPFGGYDKGSYDWDVSNQNWATYLLGKRPPSTIQYHSSVECIYKEKWKFGYAPWERIKTPLNSVYNMKVRTYDYI